MPDFNKLTNCLVCESEALSQVLDLGLHPAVNRFPFATDPLDPVFPLELMRCGKCGHCQLSGFVDPKYLFSDYAYVSGTTDVLKEHAKTILNILTEHFAQDLPVDKTCSLLEIGSNDGTLLQLMAPNFSNVVGVDPALNLVEESRSRGIETIAGFFHLDLAREVISRYKTFDIILARHVFAHVPDPLAILKGMALCLAPRGVIAIEVPHLISMFENIAFDTIYHEHINYFSLHALRNLAERAHLNLVHNEEVPIHGGSTLAFFAHKDSSYPLTQESRLFLEKEKNFHILDERAICHFVEQSKIVLESCKAYFIDVKSSGRRVWGYGASAKAQVLLNTLKVGNDVVELILDRSPYKVGRVTPGMRIPVVHPEECKKRGNPEEIVIFSWNLAAEIVDQLEKIFPSGVQMLRIIPKRENLFNG